MSGNNNEQTQNTNESMHIMKDVEDIVKESPQTSRGFLVQDTAQHINLLEPTAPIRSTTETLPWDLQAIADKPIRIATFNWTTAQAAGSIIMQPNFPSAMRNGTSSTDFQGLINVLSRFARYNFSYEHKLVMNSTPFHTGVVRIAALPFGGQSGMTSYNNSGRAGVMTTASVEITADSPKATTITVAPHVINNSIPTTARYNNYAGHHHRLVMTVVSPLIVPEGASTSVQFTLYTQLRDVKLMLPTPYRQPFPALTLKFLKDFTETEVYRRIYDELEETDKKYIAQMYEEMEDEERQYYAQNFWHWLGGAVQTVIKPAKIGIHALGSALGYINDELGKPVKDMASNIGSAAGSIIRIPGKNLVQMDGKTVTAAPLGRGMTAAMVENTHVQDAITPNYVDMGKLDTLIDTVTWSTTASEGTVIYSTPVTLTACANAYTSAASAIGGQMAYYRGSIIVTIKVVKNKFMSGRLAATIIPPKDLNGSPIVDDEHLDFYPQNIIDCTDTSEVVIHVPYMGPMGVKRALPAVDVAPSEDSDAVFLQAILKIRVINPLITNGSNPQADVLIYQRWDDDMRVFDPFYKAVDADIVELVSMTDMLTFYKNRQTQQEVEDTKRRYLAQIQTDDSPTDVTVDSSTTTRKNADGDDSLSNMMFTHMEESKSIVDLMQRPSLLAQFTVPPGKTKVIVLSPHPFMLPTLNSGLTRSYRWLRLLSMFSMWKGGFNYELIGNHNKEAKGFITIKHDRLPVLSTAAGIMEPLIVERDTEYQLDEDFIRLPNKNAVMPLCGNHTIGITAPYNNFNSWCKSVAVDQDTGSTPRVDTHLPQVHIKIQNDNDAGTEPIKFMLFSRADSDFQLRGFRGVQYNDFINPVVAKLDIGLSDTPVVEYSDALWVSQDALQFYNDTILKQFPNMTIKEIVEESRKLKALTRKEVIANIVTDQEEFKKRQLMEPEDTTRQYTAQGKYDTYIVLTKEMYGLYRRDIDQYCQLIRTHFEPIKSHPNKGTYPIAIINYETIVGKEVWKHVETLLGGASTAEQQLRNDIASFHGKLGHVSGTSNPLWRTDAGKQIDTYINKLKKGEIKCVVEGDYRAQLQFEEARDIYSNMSPYVKEARHYVATGVAPGQERQNRALPCARSVLEEKLNEARCNRISYEEFAEFYENRCILKQVEPKGAIINICKATALDGDTKHQLIGAFLENDDSKSNFYAQGFFDKVDNAAEQAESTLARTEDCIENINRTITDMTKQFNDVSARIISTASGTEELLKTMGEAGVAMKGAADGAKTLAEGATEDITDVAESVTQSTEKFSTLMDKANEMLDNMSKRSIYKNIFTPPGQKEQDFRNSGGVLDSQSSMSLEDRDQARFLTARAFEILQIVSSKKANRIPLMWSALGHILIDCGLDYTIVPKIISKMKISTKGVFERSEQETGMHAQVSTEQLSGIFAALVMGVGAITYGKLPSDSTTAKGIANMSAKFGNVGKIASGLRGGISTIFPIFRDMINEAMLFFAGERDPAMRAAQRMQDDYPHIQRWLAEVNNLVEPDAVIRASRDADYRMYITQLKEIGQSFEVTLMNVKMETIIIGAIRDRNRLLRKITDAVFTETKDTQIRYDPYCMCLFGEAGTGKSWVFTKLVRDLGNYFKIEESNRVYCRGGSDHWDNYRDQWATYIDDFGQATDDKEYVDFIKLKSNNSFVLPMASLQTKGTTFKSHVLGLTMNQPYTKPKSIYEDTAWFRRRDVMIEVSCISRKDQFGRYEREDDNSHMRFTIYDSFQKIAVSRPMQYAELREYLRVRMINHFNGQKKSLEKGGYLVGCKYPDLDFDYLPNIVDSPFRRSDGRAVRYAPAQEFEPLNIDERFDYLELGRSHEADRPWNMAETIKQKSYWRTETTEPKEDKYTAQMLGYPKFDADTYDPNMRNHIGALFDWADQKNFTAAHNYHSSLGIPVVETTYIAPYSKIVIPYTAYEAMVFMRENPDVSEEVMYEKFARLPYIELYYKDFMGMEEYERQEFLERGAAPRWCMLTPTELSAAYESKLSELWKKTKMLFEVNRGLAYLTSAVTLWGTYWVAKQALNYITGGDEKPKKKAKKQRRAVDSDDETSSSDEMQAEHYSTDFGRDAKKKVIRLEGHISRKEFKQECKMCPKLNEAMDEVLTMKEENPKQWKYQARKYLKAFEKTIMPSFMKLSKDDQEEVKKCCGVGEYVKLYNDTYAPTRTEKVIQFTAGAVLGAWIAHNLFNLFGLRAEGAECKRAITIKAIAESAPEKKTPKTEMALKLATLQQCNKAECQWCEKFDEVWEPYIDEPTKEMDEDDYYDMKKSLWRATLEHVETRTPLALKTRPFKSEGSCDPNALGVIEKTFTTLYSIRNVTRGCTMNCAAVGGRIMLIPRHFVENCREEDLLQFTLDGERRYMTRFQNSRVLTPREQDEKMRLDDWCLYKACENLPPQKHIWQQFWSEKDIGKLNRCGALLILRNAKGERIRTNIPELVTRQRQGFGGPKTVVKNGQITRVTEEYVAIGAISYEGVTTEDGFCGGLLVALNPNMPQKILGMHVAGCEECGITHIITREMLEPYMLQAQGSNNGIPIPSYVVQDLEMMERKGIVKIPKGSSIEPVGWLAPQHSVRIPDKTNVRPSVIHGVFPVTSGPAVLSPKDKRFQPYNSDGTLNPSPLQQGVNGWGQYIKPFYYSDLEQSQQIIETRNESLTPRNFPRKVLTWDQAVNGGREISKCARRVDMTTSPGYPWIQTRPSGSRGKEYLFTNINEVGEEPFYVMGDELMQAVLKREEAAKRNERVESVWYDMLKDERRSHAKIKVGKTRNFVIGPVDYTILFRKYFYSFMMMAQEQCTKGTSRVGINPVGTDWTAMYEQLRAMGVTTVAGDYEKFDRTEAAYIIHLYGVAANAWYNDGEENARVRTILMEEAAHRLTISGNVVMVVHQGLPSGFPATAPCNGNGGDHYINTGYIRLSIWVMNQGVDPVLLGTNASIEETDVIRYLLKDGKQPYIPVGFVDPTPECVRHLDAKLTPAEEYEWNFVKQNRDEFEDIMGPQGMKKNVAHGTYGDDLLASVTERALKMFNFGTFRTYLAHFGINFTPEDKGAVAKSYQHLHESTFLKRKFTPHPRYRDMILAPMDMTVLQEECNWIHASEDDASMTQQVVDSSIREAFHHGKAVFDEHRKTLNAALCAHGLEPVYHTYEDLERKWFTQFDR